MLLNSLLVDYKENCKIKNSIIDWKKEENDFKIYVYCFEKIKISIKKKKHLTKLYHKHGLSWIAFDPPEVTKKGQLWLIPLIFSCTLTIFLILTKRRSYIHFALPDQFVTLLL